MVNSSKKCPCCKNQLFFHIVKCLSKTHHNHKQNQNNLVLSTKFCFLQNFTNRNFKISAQFPHFSTLFHMFPHFSTLFHVFPRFPGGSPVVPRWFPRGSPVVPGAHGFETQEVVHAEQLLGQRPVDVSPAAGETHLEPG